MEHFRYGAQLRPFTQLNLRRLESCDFSFRNEAGFAHGTMAFHRRLTPFEESQLDLTFLGQENEERCSWP
jgi:hypothetical protein